MEARMASLDSDIAVTFGQASNKTVLWLGPGLPMRPSVVWCQDAGPGAIQIERCGLALTRRTDSQASPLESQWAHISEGVLGQAGSCFTSVCRCSLPHIAGP